MHGARSAEDGGNNNEKLREIKADHINIGDTIMSGIKFFTNIKYQEVALKDYKCCFYGIFVYKYRQQGLDSARTLLLDFISNNIDFDSMFGSFRVIIEAPSGEIVFFSDNSNNCCFYCNTITGCYSDSFLNLCEHSDSLSVNYESLAQFMLFGCVYGNQMFFNEIERTDSDNYYVLSGGRIKKNSKNLSSFEKTDSVESISDYFNRFTSSLKGIKIADVVTGGVDSRMVLCNLLQCGVAPELFIAEEPGHIDVKIAQEIANIIDAPLHIISHEYADTNFVEDAYYASDGVFSPLSRYYLVLMRKEIKKRGFAAVFGGVCGELYKNSFINQDFPCYFGNTANLAKMYSIKVAASKVLPVTILGERLKNIVPKVPEIILAEMKKYTGDSKKATYFNIGYWIMKQRVVSVSNAANNTVPFISPLLERAPLSIAYRKNPYLLEMQAFARREVSSYSARLASVRTDRNLTCRYGAIPMLTEAVSNYAFLTKLYIKRRLNKQKPELQNSSYFISQLLHDTVKVNYLCNVLKEYGILSVNSTVNELPLPIKDRIFLLGTLLSKQQNILQWQ